MDKMLKRRLMAAVVLVFLLAVLGGGLFASRLFPQVPAAVEKTKEALTGQETKRPLTIDEQVEEIVSSMSTTEKIGQLMVIGVQGTEANEDALYVLHQFHYGGIILFDRNLESKAQTKALVQDLQAGADEKLPLFVGIDEEGGRVVRGKDFITPPPSQEAVGKQGEPQQAQKLAKSTAAELKEMGINVNFAPVADVGAADGRSYSKEPYETLKFVQAAGEGYKESGMVYALKHFPGIGRGLVDSHKEISSIEAGESELRKVDLVPFREMINDTGKGKDLDYMVMVGHLNYPAFDKDNPASLSRKIITDLLRQEMGYQGLVITDDLEMGAIANHRSFRQVGVEAILAGCDIVLVCHEYQHAEDVYMGIYEAVQNGKISEMRLNESVRRVVKAKLLHGLRPADH
ncbi:hypothetical protein SELR_03290 [Selenomonas ruminantium subsp. lactilytica TAM6421]|uniref:Glycoside hydrolase family 3 N-terminal domain-containing protein n=1 Tax=Selenomonas ruminantium subsp. lactilytica (strain NBRC 103574 / TAM6421) TaxID=927704 RepID=I0GMQ0_SELRL|nr:glycoside hydrolase family 3 protein [Selenomonas ruminantium]BAL82037.1 hypothetical protein SELR_03290 [Selenomonas ruminantium subsp. lactilytica TAM6421]